MAPSHDDRAVHSSDAHLVAPPGDAPDRAMARHGETMSTIAIEQRRPIKAWRLGICRKCKGETWTTPIVHKASGFGYLPTGKVHKQCAGCGYAVIGPGAR
jgi:hypothetical protein